MIGVNTIREMKKIDEEKNTLKLKLDEFRKLRDLVSIDFSHNINIDRDKSNKNEIERENERYKLIAKLSFDLYIDYEYYKEFSIKNKSQFENCAEELTNLGYELRESEEWVNVRRPNIDAIIDQIFMSHLCRSILGQLAQNEIGRKNQAVRNDENSDENNSSSIEQWKCVNCGIRTLENQSMCDHCVNWSNEKKTFIDKHDWICQYALCEKTNNDSDVYCKSCGIQKSSVLIIEAPMWRYKNDKYDQIWICAKCAAINEIGKDVCCGCFFSVDQSKKDIQLNIDEENKRQCETCESMIPENQSICENCIQFCSDNNVSIETRAKCKICESNKEIIGEGMCGDCFSNLYSDWICPYTLCGETNVVKDKWCKSCGIKRLDVLIIGAPLWRRKNYIRDQIWICGKCEIINELGKVCDNCGITMDQSSRNKTVKNQQSKEKNQPIINNKIYWVCENCGLVNDAEFLLCVCCKCTRPVIWNCSYCSSKNEISVDVCVVCQRQRNENLEKKYCEKCGQREQIMEGLCGKCVLVRESEGICSNRLCRFRNSANDDYCRNCGLYRYGYLEHGAPIYQRLNKVFCLVWICECGGINKWEQIVCENSIPTLAALSLKLSQKCNSFRHKYFKWCPFCICKHEKNNLICKTCTQKL